MIDSATGSRRIDHLDPGPYSLIAVADTGPATARRRPRRRSSEAARGLARARENTSGPAPKRGAAVTRLATRSAHLPFFLPVGAGVGAGAGAMFGPMRRRLPDSWKVLASAFQAFGCVSSAYQNV
ncbi:hypothetical protein SAMN02745121_00384 [Nannocystis exedens]|uniref:Uncharacterized protein n=1 Tax=Nannocystis exedens TaxID=54 RepID=A0A1I1SZ69_9BACT|nr:hypothetical protein NAEX_09484 [Nannocystis exedens]SFD51745.1 hypothetical protein SAMN02745121_00384 [Nannocystis exedens]